MSFCSLQDARRNNSACQNVQILKTAHLLLIRKTNFCIVRRSQRTVHFYPKRASFNACYRGAWARDSSARNPTEGKRSFTLMRNSTGIRRQHSTIHNIVIIDDFLWVTQFCFTVPACCFPYGALFKMEFIVKMILADTRQHERAGPATSIHQRKN